MRLLLGSEFDTQKKGQTNKSKKKKNDFHNEKWGERVERCVLCCAFMVRTIFLHPIFLSIESNTKIIP